CLWLRNGESLAELQVETKRNLTGQRLKTGRACRMREVLQDICTDGRTPSEAWVRLHRLCSWMMHSRLKPMKDLARMIRRHFAGIVAYFGHPYANAVLEGADGVIRNVKRRARGFRDMDHSATMIYLTCGRLDLKAVTTT
ncbi:transposase, partial [Bifidobacterium longum]